MSSSATIQFQEIAIQYCSLFQQRITEAVNKYSVSKVPTTIQVSGTAAKAQETVLEDTTSNNRLIEKAGEDIFGTNPSGVTLNQFKQPEFTQALSILDAIRNESNYPVGKLAPDINVAGTSIPQASDSTQTDCLNTALSYLSLEEKTSMIEGLLDKIKKNNESLGTLNAQNKKIKNSLQFKLTSIMSGVMPAGSALIKQTGKYIEDSASQVIQGAVSTKDEVVNMYKSGKNTVVSTYNNIFKSNPKDLNPIPEELFNELKIPKFNIKPISKESINKVLENLGKKKIECKNFNTLIDITNKAASKETVTQSQAVAQKTSQQLKEIQNQIDTITSDNIKLEGLLKQLS